MRGSRKWCSVLGFSSSLLVAAVAAAQLAPIGLSEVSGQWFELQEPLFDNNGNFGEVLAAGDFNGDGVDDLAAAAPYDSNR